MANRYGSFCPVAKAAEVITGRWTPLILYELMRGSERFSDIQNGVPLMARSLLARRLREMEQDGLILRIRAEGQRGHIYRLTPAGDALRPLIDLMGYWATDWRVPYIDAEDRNVTHLMWSMRNALLGDASRGSNMVFHFRFRNVPSRDHKLRQWWMILRDGEIDLCYTDMGFEVDLTVDADLLEFFRVVHGIKSLRQARRAGEVEITGRGDALDYFMERFGITEPPQPHFATVSDIVPPVSIRTTIQAA
ncbi:winged helix-turn-helix transcriptional regulator [Ferrovibrio sp.]|jgi:DNA-binding HxlR family transcriptional regulator|uniref:winged helix-turn-helix transcriptional regulator n=1 Tax=Ferrovibrio sp. TaxID=1917215 RepID=UPI0035B4DDAF